MWNRIWRSKRRGGTFINAFAIHRESSRKELMEIGFRKKAFEMEFWDRTLKQRGRGTFINASAIHKESSRKELMEIGFRKKHSRWNFEIGHWNNEGGVPSSTLPRSTGNQAAKSWWKTDSGWNFEIWDTFFYRIFIDFVLISDLQNHHFFYNIWKTKNGKLIDCAINRAFHLSRSDNSWKAWPKKAKMKAKISQNHLLEASWNLLGPSWGLLGASWAQLGHILKKTFKKPPPLEANLGAKINNKSKKIDVRKAFVLRYVFLSDFHRFCIVFGPSKPPFFDNVWL